MLKRQSDIFYVNNLRDRNWNREWIESSDVATLSYSLERLKFYNIQLSRSKSKVHQFKKTSLEFALTFKGIWSDGHHVICLDDDIANDTFVYYDPLRSSHTILDDILEKFKDASSLDIIERTQRQLIQLFQKEIDYGVWIPSLEDPDQYIIDDS